MIKCPLCGNQESKVIDSRGVGDGIRRRRQCLSCGRRYTTNERIVTRSLYVVKKDGRREEYIRDKLRNGILKACEKRPLPIGTIDKIVENIESDIYRLGKNEVNSSYIGDRVMEHLARIDHVAYIRFASVYRDFADINALKKEVDYIVEKRMKTVPIEQLSLLNEDIVNATKEMRKRK